ncbi:carboxypeptidase regulatory-like domain-containing protein [Acidobacterium sp. S8]|uniref:TonB-dependent receptor n=1 Tax=Acidobacterium sp. S8 TaxID=1641854 RepID=UPI00131EA272|nr:carboxypeptidase regulatory-like domain-containing protein [Acidobacterium sp. S8]
MLRTAFLSALLVCPAACAFAVDAPAAPAASSSVATINGTVTDTTGAIIPGAQVQLTDATGAVLSTATTDPSGSFRIQPPRQGDYSLTVNLQGFQTSSQQIHVGATAGTPVAFALSIAEAVTQVEVNASSNVDLTASDANGDTAVMSSDDLKAMPVFDNDYVTAMSSFLDSGEGSTAGTGLMVDGVEANRAMISPSAVQEVHINQDPYSAQYYRPGRGQLEIITKQAADSYHGQLNFLFRDASLNAQNAFAPSKPPEQRRIYEGNVTGPLWHAKNSAFLFSFNRAEEDLSATVNATVAPTQDNPDGIFNENVPAPTRDTEFSLRVGHQFSDENSASVMYAFQDATNRNQGVGNQTLPEAGYNTETREDDVILHDDYIVSPSILNQASIVLERSYDPTSNVVDQPRVTVQGNFTGGSAQNAQDRTEYNLRANEMVSWTKGPHNLKFGINLPHMSRRVLEDHTNNAGSYTYGPTYAADGTLLATAIQNYQAGIPSGFSIQQGQTRFVYHQQEVGGFIQDQIKLSPIFSLTPGLRYDWQNFPGNDTNNFSPRLSFALVLDKEHEMVVRGGGGIYYDRTGSGPISDLARYEYANLRLLQLSSNQQPLCNPIEDCADLNTLPPSLVERAPNLKTPYQINYGISIDRKVGEKGTLSIGGRINRGVNLYRSVDINAPTAPDYSVRPDADVAQLRQIQSEGNQNGSALDVNYRGRLNKRFTGFAWYTWSHYGNNTSGIYWFPQNQYAPNAEWGPADWDQRQHFGLYGMINPDHLLNLGIGVFTNTGKPWTVTTGEDSYGTNLFNARPDDVPRNSEIGPDYTDLDLRWGYDFKLHPKEVDKSPTLGVSASAFNVLNHENGSFVDTVEGSEDFGQVTSAYPARRMQLAMRFNF